MRKASTVFWQWGIYLILLLLCHITNHMSYSMRLEQSQPNLFLRHQSAKWSVNQLTWTMCQPATGPQVSASRSSPSLLRSALTMRVSKCHQLLYLLPSASTSSMSSMRLAWKIKKSLQTSSRRFTFKSTLKSRYTCFFSKRTIISL